jgi:hypothetical protein
MPDPVKRMINAQAVRIQRELVPGSGCVPSGEPFLTYGIWVLPFTHSGIGLTVFLIDRSITSEADHNRAMEEAVQAREETVRRLKEASLDRRPTSLQRATDSRIPLSGKRLVPSRP